MVGAVIDLDEIERHVRELHGNLPSLTAATVLELVRLARVGQTWEGAYTAGKLGREVSRMVCDPDLKTVEYGSWEWLEKISANLSRVARSVVERGENPPTPEG